MKRILALALLAAVLLAACAAPAPAPTPVPTPAPAPDPVPEPEPTNLIGISLIEGDEYRGERMKSRLEEDGWEVWLEYTPEGDEETQQMQINYMVSCGARGIIAAETGYEVNTLLYALHDSGLPVVSFPYDYYDYSEDPLCYVRLDFDRIIELQADYLAEALGLRTAQEPRTIEFAAGDATVERNGILADDMAERMAAYLDSGALRTTERESYYWLCNRWDGETVPEETQARMERILSESYADTPLDAVWAQDDECVEGVLAALASTYHGETRPILTGRYQEDPATLRRILDGTQDMTVLFVPNDAADKAVDLLEQLLSGQSAELTSFGGVECPGAVIAPRILTRENFSALLYDTGWFTPDQLEP